MRKEEYSEYWASKSAYKPCTDFHFSGKVLTFAPLRPIEPLHAKGKESLAKRFRSFLFLPVHQAPVQADALHAYTSRMQQNIYTTFASTFTSESQLWRT